MDGTVRGRFAPTPSGRMHAGNVLAALVAWLSVRSQGGTLVLRIEDLDPRAQKPEAALLLMDDLRWLGLGWDEGPIFQSQRRDIYEEAKAALSRRGLTYPCFCTRAELHAASAPHAEDGTYIYQGTCRHLTPEEVARRAALRPAACRLIVPDADDPAGTISFDDAVYGRRTEILARDCGDFLIQRSDGVFAYQLAVAVDDGLMGITEVVRGRDLLGSCARQIYIQRLLGFSEPRYAHVPLLVSPEGRRLSKRDRDLDLDIMRSRYGRPEPIIGMLAASLGLAEPGEELLPEDLVPRFSWDTIRAHSEDIVANGEFLRQAPLVVRRASGVSS